VRDQCSDGYPNHVRVTARPFTGGDLVFVKAVGMPVTSAKQKRLASELDQRCAKRILVLAEGRDGTRWEIVEHRDIRAQLLESEAALHSIQLLAGDGTTAKLANARRIARRMLREISPIGETSPVTPALSSE
jgi:hypothetical protein